MPLILGTNSIKDTSYDVANSLRFNSADSARLTRTQTSGDRNKATFSAWVKRSKLGANQGFFGIHGASSDAGQIEIRFQSSGEGFHISGQATNWRRTNRAFRDVSAWYHLVVAFDTTLSTANDRVKVYVNGVQETSFAASGNPSQDSDLPFGLNSATCSVGSDFNAGSAGNFFGGYLAEVVLIDGQQLDATSFGEFDEDSPTIWQPKDVSGLTFGNNGFYLDFEDSSSLGNDAAGSNNFTATNLATTDQSTDTCTNNFATLNPLNVPTSNAPTFSEGNLISSTSDSAQFGGTSTIGVSSGKWYAEFKGAETGGEEKEMVGVTHAPAEDARSGDNVGRTAESFAIRFLDGQQSNNNSASAYGSAFSIGDICQVALDIDNNNLYFGKNGQWGDGSGNFNQSTPTSAITIPTIANTTEGAYFFSVGDISSTSGRCLISCNFGSPPFSISSGNADGNGYGNMEYSVPSGYYTLCTKNLAEYG